MGKVITRPEQVTPKWLTNVLNGGGFLSSGKVIRIENKLTKKLPFSVVSRLKIYYSDDAPVSIPAKIFLKISSAHGAEAEFYNLVASAMDNPPFIRCYHAVRSSDSENYHLLLDDLSETHFQPESSQSLSVEFCELAVDGLARLHAFWWNHPELGKSIGKIFDENELTTFVDDVERKVCRFLDFLGDECSPEQRKIYEQMLAAKYKIWRHLTGAKNLTVIHGDAHWWNFLYPLDKERHQVCLFDWQLWHVDLGARDLAFMIALGGYSERRKSIERSLLRFYYERLTGYGVKNYSWKDFENNYKFSAVRNLNIPVIEWSRGSSAELWQPNLERALAAFEDLGCSEIL